MRSHPYFHCAVRLGVLPLICLGLHAADAGSATWNLNPATNDWNTATNWTPATVPDATTDTATFGPSNTTSISISAESVDLADLVFTQSAPLYTINTGEAISLIFWGDGVRNDSGVEQTFTGNVSFHENSSASDDVTYDVDSVHLYDESSAGSASIYRRRKTQGTLTPGLVLTVISNTSANPISGTFSNLADGAIVNVGGTNFQAHYQGGDGNDLTLTVVP
jgi:hypothetical protein